jgi:hypothetical protein
MLLRFSIATHEGTVLASIGKSPRPGLIPPLCTLPPERVDRQTMA